MTDTPDTPDEGLHILPKDSPEDALNALRKAAGLPSYSEKDGGEDSPE